MGKTGISIDDVRNDWRVLDSEPFTIASRDSILNGKHQHGYKEIDKPIQEQPGVFRKVTIGENSWIGNGAIIMDDLGVQNVIAAGSVVVSKTNDYEILAGNPAKVIKTFGVSDGTRG